MNHDKAQMEADASEYIRTSKPPTMIPQEIKDKIEAEAKLGSNARTYPCHPGHIHFRAFISGGSFGYSLALPTIQAQEERIRVLEEALRIIRDGGYTGAYMIAHEALTKALAGRGTNP